MSYFFGSTSTNGFINRGRRKHARHRSTSNDSDVASIHGSKHRKKHSSSGKSILKPKSFKDSSVRFDLSDVSSKGKSKRCLHKEIARLVEQNNVLTTKLEGTNPRSVSSSAIKERDELLLNLKKKYLQLEQNYYEMQADHDRISLLLAKRENELRQLNMNREESTLVIRNLEQERNKSISLVQKFKTDNSQLHEDVNLLKNLVYRLNVEIEKYQDKFRSEDNKTVVIDETEVNYENKHVLETWGKVNFHALSPLLNAYDENINEKNDLVQKFKKELDHFTGKLKNVITENEDLHIQIENFRVQVHKCTEEMKTVEKDAAIIKEHNDLLSRQIALQRQKLQEVHAVYERKVESMSEDNGKLHKDYTQCKTELSNLKGKYEIMSQEYEKFNANIEKTMPVSVHNKAVEECRRLFEELKQQYDSEKKKLNNRIKYLEEIVPENEKQIAILTAERDQLKNQLTNSELHSKEAQHQLKDLQKVSHSIEKSRDFYEQKLTKCNIRCKKLLEEQKKIVLEKNKLAELLREKEKENENIQYLGSNIAWRMSNLKSQLKIVQEGAKEQLATVEKHIKNQEQGADQLKSEYQREMQRLKQLLLQKDDIIQKLQREKATTQDNLEMMWRAATSSGRK
ncbi:protein Cep89 homolog [Phymastichus coffea]|uniref:protein Cep89 homolog n=1 Tax=Phymastichus coffea TaxID=108790 RepID=UPI00273B563F|nr:protein Cep89 homolog [Phymastichus coffea]